MSHSKNTTIYIIIFKVLVTLALSIGLWYQLQYKNELYQIEHVFYAYFQYKNIIWLICIVVLSIIHFSIEAKKWQILSIPFERINFKKAIAAILSGNTFSIFTPNRIGEYAGRILFLDEGKRIKGVAATIVGSLSQLISSYLLGFIGFIIFLFYYSNYNNFIQISALFVGLIIWLILVFSYYNVKMAYWILLQLKLIRKYAHYLSFLRRYKQKQLFELNVYSLIRYILFSLQYVLLIQLLFPEISLFIGFMVVFSIFFVQTITPSVALFELPLRGSIAIFFWNHFSVPESVALSATFILWMLNIVIPAIFGIFIILFIRIKWQNNAA